VLSEMKKQTKQTNKKKTQVSLYAYFQVYIAQEGIFMGASN